MVSMLNIVVICCGLCGRLILIVLLGCILVLCRLLVMCSVCLVSLLWVICWL